MKLDKLFLMVFAVSSFVLFTQCEKDGFLLGDINQEASDELLNKPADVGGDESVGNCLSFPVIWSDGSIDLRGTPDTPPVLEGEWYYVWGTDPVDPADMDNLKSAGPYAYDETPTKPDTGGETLYKAFIQKDANNVWQAANWSPEVATTIDFIDWGDNLESVDWTIKSQVRTEVVLYESITPGDLTQYAMRHCDGWGSSEVHGLQTLDNSDNSPVGVPSEHTAATGDLATVYSENARLTIQKFFETDKGNIDDPIYNNIKWDADQKVWTNSGKDIINEEALFNMAVHEAGDGPGYYSAEVNVKGKLIYGYTWNLKKMNDGEGYYRITFSFDERGGKTFFDSTTQIMVPVEEDPEDINEVVGEGDTGSEPDQGAEAHMWQDNNTGLTVTYIDILITKQRRGGGRDGVGTGGNSGSGSGSGQGGSGSGSGSGGTGGSGGSGGTGGSGGSGHNGGGGH